MSEQPNRAKINTALDAAWSLSCEDADCQAWLEELASPYGYCPKCGARGVRRERRPNGNDTCVNRHVYPSRSALTK